MFIEFFNTKQKIFIENGKIKKKILYRVFSATDIFDLLIFQLKRPDKLAINILLVKLEWDIFILSNIAIHMIFSMLV